jgi:hypothetical protein
MKKNGLVLEKNTLPPAKCQQLSKQRHCRPPTRHIQIFNELRGKLQDILMAVKAIVGARKKGRGGTAGADEIGGE